MGKSTNKRIYLDYNATSPLAKSVTDWMAEGDFYFANPSSIHTSGKKAKRLVREASEYLYSLYALTDFNLFYHSGATEAINSIIGSLALEQYQQKKQVEFFCFSTDHSCVVNQKSRVETLGHAWTELPVDGNGEFDEQLVISKMRESKAKIKFLNYTWVNNETGVVWPLEKAIKIKQKIQCIVHVDAVQAVGKVPSWNELSKELDAFTFSSHKFGALKGIGFSFLGPQLAYTPFIRGGGQQGGLRSGTENTFGIYSTQLALEEMNNRFNPNLSKKVKNDLEKNILERLETKGKIVGVNAGHRNLNTITFVLPGKRSDQLSMTFDMAGYDVGTGSACSSGSVRPSRVLMNMGHCEKEALSTIRLSLPSLISEKDYDAWKPNFLTILQRVVQ